MKDEVENVSITQVKHSGLVCGGVSVDDTVGCKEC